MNSNPSQRQPEAPAEARRRGRWLAGVGAVGLALSALCCFTPLLVLTLAGLGLVAWSAYADWLLLPLMAGSLLLLAAGLLRLRRAGRSGARAQVEDA